MTGAREFDRYGRPDESDRYMGRCCDCDRSVAEHDETVCDWIPVPDRGQWQLRNAEGGIEAAMLHVGCLETLGRETSSRILWEQAIPPGCSLTMQTSIDFERTWLDATRGESIPGFSGLDQLGEIRSRAILRGSGTSMRDLMVSVTYGEAAAEVLG